MKTLLALLLLSSSSLAGEPSLTGEMKVTRDVPYVQPKEARRTLDVYAPAEGKDHPVMIWIHGGGWRIGNKTGVQQKPQAFVDQGFVFVSVNYRFVPDVTVTEMAGDIAAAVKWVHDHAAEYGGRPDQIFVAGHSAGAHLAALVCTDESYLKSQGLSLADIRGCIPVDSAAYDVQRQIKSLGRLRAQTYTSAFGRDEAVQKKLSPLTHVPKAEEEKAAGDTTGSGKPTNKKQIPPFLILHVASRADSSAQSNDFAKALQAAGYQAKVVPGENKTHASINRELGNADDPPTVAVFEFLRNVLKQSVTESSPAKSN